MINNKTQVRGLLTGLLCCCSPLAATHAQTRHELLRVQVSMPKAKLPSQVLPLHTFIRRGKVLAQYRRFLRLINGASLEARPELRQQVREQFRRYKNEADAAVVNHLLAQGQQQMKVLEELVFSASTRYPMQGSGGAPPPTQAAQSTQADRGARDVLGRLGEGWPWERAEA